MRKLPKAFIFAEISANLDTLVGIVPEVAAMKSP